MSTEVEASFAKAAVASTISHTWSTSNTYHVAETHTHSVGLSKGTWEIRQLKANYGPLTVGSNSYGAYKISEWEYLKGRIYYDLIFYSIHIYK